MANADLPRSRHGDPHAGPCSACAGRRESRPPIRTNRWALDLVIDCQPGCVTIFRPELNAMHDRDPLSWLGARCGVCDPPGHWHSHVNQSGHRHACYRFKMPAHTILPQPGDYPLSERACLRSEPEPAGAGPAYIYIPRLGGFKALHKWSEVSPSRVSCSTTSFHQLGRAGPRGGRKQVQPPDPGLLANLTHLRINLPAG